MEKQEKNFTVCQFCGKKLIERKSNGLWSFAFGRGDSGGPPPVEIEIYGSLKIKCLRRSCARWNTLNHFPFSETPLEA